jgi:hypothetical protein
MFNNATAILVILFSEKQLQKQDYCDASFMLYGSLRKLLNTGTVLYNVQ